MKLAFLFFIALFLTVRGTYAQAPNISYNSPQVYDAGTTIAPLSPINTGGNVSVPAPVIIANGFHNPAGVAVDAAGNLYVADNLNNVVKKIPAGSSTPVVIGTGFSSPAGVAVDAAGNVFVTDFGNDEVKEIPVGGGAITTLGSGFSTPYGIALDASGNIYVTDRGHNQVKKMPAGGGTPVILASGFNTPTGIAVDAAGIVYVCDRSNNAIEKISLTGFISMIARGDGNPNGIALDAAGNIYIADQSNGSIKEYGQDGRTIGLVGSGLVTPISIAIDANGYSYVSDNSVDIKKILNGAYSLNKPLPSGLIFNQSTGTFSGTPTVSSPATDYTVTAYNSSGTGSAVVNIKVLSGSLLSALKLSNGSLTPAFGPSTLNYTASVGNLITSVTIRPTASNPSSTITVNGTAVISGQVSQSINLNVGANVINTVVTAPDQSTTSYTITVTRAGSSNAALSNLVISPGIIKPTFTPTTTTYSVAVGNSTTSVTITPTTSDSTATVKVNGATVASGTASGPIQLTVGTNVITTTVTAQNGVTVKNYKIMVTRAASTNAKLLSLTTSSGGLTPSFNNTVTNYTRSVANSVTSISVTPTTVDPTATISVNGKPVKSGAASAAIPLNVGDSNVINTIVTAQDGVTQITYAITVTRAASADATLSNLTISHGTLNPTFAATTNAYTAAVNNGITSVTVTPTTNEPNATVTVNGVAVTSGTASAPVDLVVGANTITSVITAQNGIAAKTYKITVTRAPSNNAKLFNLTTSNGVLTPGFNNTQPNYVRHVPSSTDSITLTATAVDDGATIMIAGKVTPSGVGVTLPLVTGDNYENIMVTAQDNVTTMIYSVDVIRAMSPANTAYQPVSVEKPLTSPAINESDINVRQSLSPNGDGINDFLIIENITSYPNNKLQVINRSGQLVFEAKNYDNSSKVFDGHSSKTGALQNPGTYFYSLDYVVNGVAKHKTGYIVLKY